MIDNLCGVILCGGQSRRFGSDKAIATYKGISLVQRSYNVLASVVKEIVLAAGSPHREYLKNVVHVADNRPDAGPLGGIEAAFAATRADFLLILASDLPLIGEVHLLTLLENNKPPLILGRDEITKREQPLCAIWHRSLQIPLGQYLDSGKRSVLGFVGTYSYSVIDFEAGVLINVNNRFDLSE